MKKSIRIVFSKNWLFQHRNDPVNPANALIEALKTGLGESVSVRKEALHILAVVSEGGEAAGDVIDRVRSFLSQNYQLAPDGENYAIEVQDADEEDNAKEEDNPEEESREADPPEHRRRTAKPEKVTVEACMADIDALTGAEEFKALAHEIAGVAPRLSKKEKEAFFAQSYLFAINDGCGFSTYLKKLNSLLTCTGLIDEEGSVREKRLDPPKENRPTELDDFDSLSGEKMFRSAVSVMAIDISEWMNRLNTHQFKAFLETFPTSEKQILVVFRVPFIDKEVLEKIRLQLSDVLSVRVLAFPPFTNGELEECARKELAGYDYTITDEALAVFAERLNEERSDGHFYGLRTMQKVVRELVYSKCLDNAAGGKNSREITREDAVKIRLLGQNADLSAEAMLGRLVGSETIRTRIEEIVSQIQLARKNKDLGTPCIHMRFVGNPGTGKTTVARIIGRILKEKGVLRVGNFFEYSGRDFCGQYVGETAPKTSGMCRDAYGSVLFIDEAYSLYRSTDSGRDYGREALDTLIAEMENHRSDLVVIMAGYTDEMNLLMQGNPGLASRMPYVIEFPNFTRTQLYEIYESMVKEHFEYTEDLLPAARSFFEQLSEEIIGAKEFSNGRFVRNLFERTWAKASMRTQLNKEPKVVLTKDDFDRSVQDKEFSLNEKTKRPQIGFA